MFKLYLKPTLKFKIVSKEACFMYQYSIIFLQLFHFVCNISNSRICYSYQHAYYICLLFSSSWSGLCKIQFLGIKYNAACFLLSHFKYPTLHDFPKVQLYEYYDIVLVCNGHKGSFSFRLSHKHGNTSTIHLTGSVIH